MTREQMIAILREVAGSLNDGHARYPVPELGSVIEALQAEALRKIGDPDPQPFILVTVEGGIADFHGDHDVVDVEVIDYDTDEADSERLADLVEKAERIPDRLAELDRHADARWIDKPGILATLREELAEKLAAEEEA